MLRAMTPRTKKTAAALSGALVLASGAYALGTQTGDGTALAGGTPTGSKAGAPPGRPGGPRDLSGIAAQLGVTEAKLRAALEDLRPDRGGAKDEVARPRSPRRWPPSSVSTRPRSRPRSRSSTATARSSAASAAATGSSASTTPSRPSSASTRPRSAPPSTR